MQVNMKYYILSFTYWWSHAFRTIKIDIIQIVLTQNMRELNISPTLGFIFFCCCCCCWCCWCWWCLSCSFYLSCSSLSTSESDLDVKEQQLFIDQTGGGSYLTLGELGTVLSSLSSQGIILFSRRDYQPHLGPFIWLMWIKQPTSIGTWP